MESKFKISVLAASVVMGLGFTSVALAAGSNTQKEATDKKTETPSAGSSYLVTIAPKLSDNVLTTLETNKKVTGTTNPFVAHFAALTTDSQKDAYKNYVNFGNRKEQFTKAFNTENTKVVSGLNSVFLTPDAKNTVSLIKVAENGATGTIAALTYAGAAIDKAKIKGIINPIAISIDTTPTSGNSLFAQYNAKQNAWADATFDLFSKAEAAITGGATALTGDPLAKANAKATEIKKLAEIWAFQKGAERSKQIADQVWASNAAVINDFDKKVKVLVDATGLTATTVATAPDGAEKTLFQAYTNYQTAKTGADAADAGLSAKKDAGEKYKALVAAAKGVGTFAATQLATDITNVSNNYDKAITLAADSLGKITNTEVTALSDTGIAKPLKDKLNTLLKANKLDKLDELALTEKTLTDAVDSLATDVSDTTVPSVAPAKEKLKTAKEERDAAATALKAAYTPLKENLMARDTANNALKTLQNTQDALNKDINSTTPSPVALALKDRMTIFNTVSALQANNTAVVEAYQTALNATPQDAAAIKTAFDNVVANSRALAYGGAITPTTGATAITVPAGVLTNTLMHKLEILDKELGDPVKLAADISTANAKVASAEKGYDDAAKAYTEAKAALASATAGGVAANITAAQTTLTAAETALKAAAGTLAADGTTSTPLADLTSITVGANDTINGRPVMSVYPDLQIGALYTAEMLRRNPVGHSIGVGAAGDVVTNKNVLAAVQASINATNKVGESVRTFNDKLTTRGDLVHELERFGAVLPFSSAAEATNLYTRYDGVVKSLTELDKEGKTLSLAAQEAAQTNGPHTLYLGSLTKDQASKLDGNGNIAYLLGLRDTDGKLKTKFTQDDIYTGKKETVGGKEVITPIYGTVFSVVAPQVSADINNDNTITVGGKDAQNMMNVYSSTFQYRNVDIDKPATLGLSGLDVSRANNSGAAITVTGNLKTGKAVFGIGEKGDTIPGVTAVHPDKIVLENMNIFNNVDTTTLDGMTKKSGINLLKNIPGDQNRGTDNDPNYGVATGLLIDSDGVNSQIANEATFAQIANGVDNPVSIELKNVHIKVHNDLDNKEARAVDLSGSGNHIKIIGGEITAVTKDVPQNPTLNRSPNTNVQQQTKGAEVALRFTGHSNFLEFDGTKIKGDIVDTHDFVTVNGQRQPQTNVVSIANGTLTGDVYSRQSNDASLEKNTLNLRLDHTTWTGWSGNSNDLELKNGSTWNVQAARNVTRQGEIQLLPNSFSASVNSLLVSDGLNTIDLTYRKGNGYVSGRGPGGSLPIDVIVEQDVTVKKDAVLRINAQSYYESELQRIGGFGFSDSYQQGSLIVKHLILGEGTDSAKLAIYLQNSAAEPAVVNNRLARGIDSTVPYDFVTWKDRDTRGGVVMTSKVDLSLSPVAELGVWQYKAETGPANLQATQNEVINANQTDYRSVYFVNTGQLSNSAATVAALAASPASIASMESDALAKHMNSLRHSDSSGVWISYYGGSNKNRLNVGTDYDLKTNGVMLGVDTQLANKWLAGVAFTSAKSSLNTMQSTGDVNSYGAQFYLSRRYENGVFVDADAQFGHFSNRVSARMLDGVINRGDYSGNGYGLGVKLGYAYQNQGFFAEPYVRATGRAFSGASYILNGMNVNSTDYKSVLGEIGADLGFHVPMNNGYFKPYLHLAVLDEFANGNHVRVNNIDLNNSINGAAFQVGVGAEVQVMKNFGGYVSYDYTTGSGLERPWQATVGVNYTW